MRARHAERRGLPSELPAEELEAVPFLGRSWFARGPGYWLRRVVIVVLMLAGLAVACGIEYGLARAALAARPAALRVVLAAAVCLAFGSSFVRPVRAFRGGEARRRGGLLLRPDLLPGGGTRAGAGGAGVGALARAGSPAAAGLLLLGVVGFFGWFLLLFVYSLQREYGTEHDARLRLQQRLMPGSDSADLRPPSASGG